MELDFIIEGWAGHLSYLLLVLSMLMRHMLWLRLFVIASAMAGIAFDHFWLQNPVGVFWQSLLVLVNVAELALLWRNDRRARFTVEEDRFRETLLSGLSPGRCRRLLDLGRWETLSTGTVLTREGQRPEFLTYMASGAVRIERQGRLLRLVGEGHFIGEMSMMGDGLAVATAVMQDSGRVWRIERVKLDRLRESSPAAMAAIETGVARDMRAKLAYQNTGPDTAAQPADGPAD
ncbi:cyclic nucleotide-binding domain-containing protein [Ruegeria pomeroyi]|nr:cyclic nucleotide-binding domain-containing protein [Ruegeria pomeroyi]NVK95360.1 cyclic nucleotide-binding domain-containing protein [Ruegeria pomeroyi]NVL01833.1 cyclic nucleotide-binding domain-containing protein [Ruegeria pomeroyi]QWV07400.1 cyclic nucleotide-binding domain-containing protein [Ruegeria pomeroyi]HCE72739.1 cyclic nucleotide-binding domain-containing protein [Ruegeria sp.]